MTTQTSARAEAESRAGDVKDTVQEQAGRVAGTAAEQTREVAGDALARARDLGGELRTTVGRETGQQRDRLVGVIRDFASELDSMSSGSEQSGPAAQTASAVAQQVRRFADSVDGSTGTDLADSVRSYARRKPVTFLVGAALAGVVVGRFVRGSQAGEPSSPSSRSGPQSVGAASGRHSVAEGSTASGDIWAGAAQPVPATIEGERPLGGTRLVDSGSAPAAEESFNGGGYPSTTEFRP